MPLSLKKSKIMKFRTAFLNHKNAINRARSQFTLISCHMLPWDFWFSILEFSLLCITWKKNPTARSIYNPITLKSPFELLSIISVSFASVSWLQANVAELYFLLSYFATIDVFFWGGVRICCFRLTNIRDNFDSLTTLFCLCACYHTNIGLHNICYKGTVKKFETKLLLLLWSKSVALV